MKDVNDLFDAIGGAAVFAGIVGCEISAAREMRKRGGVRPKYWPALIASPAGRRLRLTAAKLLAINVKSPDIPSGALPEEHELPRPSTVHDGEPLHSAMPVTGKTSAGPE